jgi:ABC-type transport system involved in cytochrome bd biosynthesis fused ATPase/permease subunit
LNASFKENITFGQEFNEERYNEVVRICGLNEDLDRFEDGHDTLLVEKG